MITLCRTQDELLKTRALYGDVSFVPTMGNLHQGHISLLKEALKHHETVFFSIFVNPKQFGPSEDFDKYPRTLENDLALIENELSNHSHKNVVVFAPNTIDEVYRGFDKTIKVTGITDILEGAIRPGHFDGVTTVVYRLFDLVKPTHAYFGLKDYQQWAVIKKMVTQEKLNVQIIGMPIIRSQDGLALSSRNQYLSDKQREEALFIINTLNEIKTILDEKKENINKAQAFINNKLEDSRWDYLTMRDHLTLSEDLTHSTKLTILAVYRMGSTRLLDNIQVEIK